MEIGKGSRLGGKKVLLGVTGGIGAYKAAELVRIFIREGAEVSVVMTENATRFITPLTMETLSRNPVGLEMFSLTEERTISHIDRAGSADVFVVAPATANYIGKAAIGIADDLITTITLAVRCPLIVAPAMNSRMWSHPSVVQNIAVLQSRGVGVVPPEEGELACGEEGPGRLADPRNIVEAVARTFSSRDLEGIRILVTAGPTREPIDPVRFLSNRSTGRMGFALAEAAALRGGEVTLIAGPVSLPAPPAKSYREVCTAEEMYNEVRDALPDSDWLIMSAAVADFRPSSISVEKIKKGGKDSLSLELSRNPDILREVAALKGSRLFIGFAAETKDPVEGAKRKMKKKKLDLIVANDVSGTETGFASEENRATLIDRNGNMEDLPRMPKRVMADRILDNALKIWRKM
jgi:phosphopantothenoylcysteine decarboxylase/phosphopantothenate--cysteine ligase